ncbi:hypothetical protein [Fusobacterium ulcerans]|uniref:hypothetical protein n=1 Tax=Fusobacterium ulcerans TaxID=861 RepID=UPI0026DC612D|nr:hypothetical protein [Fusobacterium ulcerans]
MGELNIENCNLVRITCITFPPEENPSGTPIYMLVSNISNIIISKQEALLNPNKEYQLNDEIRSPDYIYFKVLKNKLKISTYNSTAISNWKILVEQLL